MSLRRFVTVIDDDESVRESLPDLLGELGFAATAFPSPESFLSSAAISQTQCLILDINMPGFSGLDLQNELKRQHLAIPIIFITARRDEEERARVMAQGAVECLFKPFSDTALVAALQTALRNQ